MTSTDEVIERAVAVALSFARKTQGMIEMDWQDYPRETRLRVTEQMTAALSALQPGDVLPNGLIVCDANKALVKPSDCAINFG